MKFEFQRFTMCYFLFRCEVEQEYNPNERKRENMSMYYKRPNSENSLQEQRNKIQLSCKNEIS